MSQNPSTLGATEESDVNIQVINRTLVNTENIDIRPFMPPCHDRLPMCLFYGKYPIDNLWNPSRGLETAGQVVGIALDHKFFINVLEKHLSYPVHTLPWFFSPFISANADPMAVERRRAFDPESVFWIDVREAFDNDDVMQSCEKPHIYSLRKLVKDFEIPASKYKDRPYWEHEYLILKRVPAKAIHINNLADHDKCMLL
ncbi:MAG: hypothetical protein Q9161_005563 [Pseudevernia consocians]